MSSQFNNLFGNFKGSSDPDPDRQKKGRSLVNEAMSQFIIRGIFILIILVLMILAAYMAFVIINAVGDQMAFVFRYVERLFQEARYMSHDARGFGAFVKLLLIAGFLGWAVRQFRRK